jgi:transcription termination factor Rho
MYAIKAIYDDNQFKLEEPVPVEEKYEVVITFISPVGKGAKKDIEIF